MIAVRFSILFSAPLAICSAIFLAKIIRLVHGADNKFED
jgi:asparagine N-glycosylation enzyme membrane subunit Stt3